MTATGCELMLVIIDVFWGRLLLWPRVTRLLWTWALRLYTRM